MSTVCRSCPNRAQRLQEMWNNTPVSSGSRRRSPGTLRSQRGVTQSIPIDGLPVTPAWSAVDRGTARVNPRPKSLRFLVRLQAEYPNTYPIVATGLKPGRKQPSLISQG
jgi:hypothetical protein